ncbi:Piso0_002582 [Millerozyma farinosa CBS 7064]|uniref:Piso0_002582 protein n=1 Tax=Pichia sorbitophila (strain ATCC MYA-4447 / BCRC 22081 / CBS 7064 / NBRC 10061 / NRRL Y-12695) TaxID=559304 RepID=G8YD01_PICSO|nr:Piso0_002582 [Millerozyma farinosa CBS 7064]
MYNDIAENVLGTIGTIFWSVQLVPQIIRNYKIKNCEGLPSSMMFLWAVSGIPFSIYFVGTNGSIPLRIQPQLFTFFCTISWAQTLYYPPVSFNVKKMILYVTAFVLISIGLEVGFILWLRPLYEDGKTWPLFIFGVIASVLLALGLIPPYFELAKRKGRVIGINFVFLTMDSLGALLSLLSIVVGNLDIMSMVLYAIVLALEMGIFSSHIIWYLRFGRREKKLENEKIERERSSCDDSKEFDDDNSNGNEC